MTKSNDAAERPMKFTPDGKFAKGNGVPAGFNVHPENRHHGAWHKENTPRFQMESIMKMSDDEVHQIIQDETRTTFERSFANVLYLSRTATDIEEANKAMTLLEKMTNQVYGTMPQVNINAEADSETEEEANKFIRGFCLP